MYYLQLVYHHKFRLGGLHHKVTKWTAFEVRCSCLIKKNSLCKVVCLQRNFEAH
jgi:hypothetical protein